MDYLEKVNRELGITVVCNLHFLSLVRRYATRVVALKNGEIVFSGSPDQIDDKWFMKFTEKRLMRLKSNEFSSSKFAAHVEKNIV